MTSHGLELWARYFMHCFKHLLPLLPGSTLSAIGSTGQLVMLRAGEEMKQGGALSGLTVVSLGAGGKLRRKRLKDHT